MTVRLMDFDGQVTSPLYHHVAIPTGNTQIHLAGQVAWDENGELVAPGDLAGQVAQVYRNVARGLGAAGATFHDVVRITWYAANWRPARSSMSRSISGPQLSSTRVVAGRRAGSPPGLSQAAVRRLSRRWSRTGRRR